MRACITNKKAIFATKKEKEMKRLSKNALIILITLSSCTHEFNYDPTDDIKSNAETIFGLIDPAQDWRTVTSGTVSITANADLDNIANSVTPSSRYYGYSVRPVRPYNWPFCLSD